MSKLKGDPGYRAGWCVHYLGVTGDHGEEVTSCEAGVEYATFQRTPFAQRPCFLDSKTGESKPGAAHCDHFRRPSPEEIALHKEWSDKRMEKFTTVMVGIAPWRKAHKGQSFAEIVECPVCKGRLHLSISSYNGHVHGRCATPDCVSWME